MNRCWMFFFMLFFMTKYCVAGDGVYVWKTDSLSESQHQQRLLSMAAKNGWSRFYIGLNARQVKAPQKTMNELKPFLKKVNGQGAQAWLLLGDPAWMSPHERPGLLKIIKDFDGLMVSGIMLDLEVEQLGWPVPLERLQKWRDTVAEAIAATNKPVEITAHWRWFDPESIVCMACDFKNIGVNGVTVMLYTTNIDRSSLIANNMASIHPFPIRLAQSVEHTLSRDESWHLWAEQERADRLQRLRQKLRVPIDWQDYESF